MFIVLQPGTSFLLFQHFYLFIYLFFITDCAVCCVFFKIIFLELCVISHFFYFFMITFDLHMSRHPWLLPSVTLILLVLLAMAVAASLILHVKSVHHEVNSG